MTTLAYCACLVAFALSNSFIVSISIAFLLGALDAIRESLRITVTQLMTPYPLRGRVQSLVYLFVVGSPLLRQAQLGAAATVLSVPGALVTGGIIGVAAVAVTAKKVYSL